MSAPTTSWTPARFRAAAVSAAVVAHAAAAVVISAIALSAPAARAAEADDPPSVTPSVHPLLAVPKDRSPGERALRLPVALAELPFRLLGAGLEQSLHFMERRDLVSRLQQLPPWLARRHVLVGDGGQGGGSGIGVAVGVFARPAGGVAAATTAWTIRGYQRHAVDLRIPAGTGRSVEAWGQVRLRAEDAFFGVGPRSSQKDETEYEQASRTAGAAFEMRPAGGSIRVDADWTEWDAVEDVEGGESDPIRAAFPDLPGLDGSTLVGAGLTFTSPAVLFRGGRAPEGGVRASARVYRDADGSRWGFTRYSLEVHRSVPLFRGDRMLVARFVATTTDPHAGREIPFHLLAVADASVGMRSFETFRFRDRDMALLNVEYRFPIWDIGLPGGTGMDAVLFADAGIVSSALEKDLDRDLVETGSGFGFRIRTERATLARLNVAFGPEATRFEYKIGRDF